MKVLLLTLFFALAPAFGASRNQPSSAIRSGSPDGYLPLRQWAEKKGFTMTYNQKELTVSITNRWANVQLVENSRRGSINGVTVWLSLPIVMHAQRLQVSKRDLDTLIEPILYPKKPQAAKKIMIVAIDAGHGGRDPGYQIGDKQEKEFTLLLARELGDMLVKAGLKIYYTRRSDTYVERAERTARARAVKADLFVSLHYNCAPNPATAKGAETYCATPYGVRSTNGGEIVLRSQPGNKFDAQSVLLAYEVQRSIIRSLNLDDRGLRRASFEVLRTAHMPSILIEGGFMSNPGDAKTIFNKEGRRELARAITDGILAYKRSMERPKNPTNS